MLPLVIDYLKTKSFQQLEDDHGVCARPNSRGDKFSLNYDQILTKSGDPVAEQCRGLIIRPTQWNWEVFKDDWKTPTVGACDVVAWPMNRFYNHGDAAAAQVNWSDPNLRIYEKLDGTMIVLYWDPVHGRWYAATRAVPEADLPIRVGHMEIGDATFSDLFLRALVETREAATGEKIDWVVDSFDKVIHLNKELTYVFELTSQFNRVVVKYDAPRVTLLAVRHTATGREQAIESLRLQHVGRPKTWEMRSVDALNDFVQQANPAELEGAVVCDSAFRRLKVKSKAWVLSSRAKDLVTVSRRGAIEQIILGKLDDVIPLVEKDVGDELLRMQGAWLQYCRSIDDNFKRFKDMAAGSRKTFAEQVMLSGDWTPAYFNMWEGKASGAREWMVDMAEREKLSTSSLDTILSKLGVTSPKA